MARRRRRRRFSVPALLVLAAVSLGAWWLYSLEQRPESVEPELPSWRKTALTSDRPDVVVEPPPRQDVSEKGSQPEGLPESQPAPTQTEEIRQLIEAGRQALSQSDPVAARAHFSEAMRLGANGADATFLRAELTRIGNETVFSSSIFENDPFVLRYVVQPGDTLGKIATRHQVSADLLARINGMRDKNVIRLGQSLKIVTGPFHAVVDKKGFALDVYLGNTFVRHYRVGLGADGSTPTGEWRVSTKLLNPTYYPPRGGQIIAADDPKNPLGEHWSGQAVGQLRYGIHGTIEHDSIGTNASLGCIRMYNEDAEELYSLLVEKHSAVTIQ